MNGTDILNDNRPAVDLSLLDQDRQPVQLSAVWKKQILVLAFVPAAFSRVCTLEMCAFENDTDEFSKLQAAVYLISTDTFFTLKAWASQQKTNLPLLSDFNKDAIAAYGVENPDLYGLKGTAKRAVFIIDRNGMIRYREILDNVANQPSYYRLKQAVAQLTAER